MTTEHMSNKICMMQHMHNIDIIDQQYDKPAVHTNVCRHSPQYV